MRARFLLAPIIIVVLTAPSVSTAERSPRCLGRRATLVGTPGADRLRGTPRSDVIAAFDGRDVIVGRGGNDRICGGPGVDTISGGEGADRIAGGQGNDTLDGESGNDRIRGGGGEDVCFQGSGNGVSASCVPVIAAAGDIACDPESAEYDGGAGTATSCRMRATSDLLLRTNLAAVLTLGDNQYENGEPNKFQVSYGPTWGRVRSITHPSPGNHDYGTPGAAGYFTYFGPAAGDALRGYYSFDIGGWHLVSLNSNCAPVGGCGPGSPQLAWLQQDLAAYPAPCILAFWHHPRFSSGHHGGDPTYEAFWQALREAGAEIVLNGHEHDYERFGPRGPNGETDPAGIREFVVGTGGHSLRTFASSPTSEVRSADSFGVLELAMASDRYAWRFVPAAPDTFTDAGSAGCH
jgi:acid phosphatase type 7